MIIGNYNITIAGSKTISTNTNSAIDIQQSIVITNNSELEQFINVYHFSGSGTNTSPFIIENLIFTIAYSVPTGFNQSNLPLFTLKNTNRYLIIRNCSFANGNYIFEGMVTFFNVSNVQVLQNTFDSPNRLTGLSIFNSGNIKIKDNYFMNDGSGILVQTYGTQLNITRSDSYMNVEIENNYFSRNYDGIFLVTYFNVFIKNNYFKDNIYDAVRDQQSPDNSSLNINHNIFDSNGIGVNFIYTFGTFQLYYNHFFNQSRYDIFFYAENNGSIFENNFIFNDTRYNENAIYTATKQPNLKLINGTSGNYYNGYNGDSFRTGIPSGFDIYEYDQFLDLN